MPERSMNLSMKSRSFYLWLGVCAILAGGVLLLVGVLSVLHAQLGHLSGLDSNVQRVVHGWTSPLLTALMLALTGIGSIFVFSCAVLFAVLLLVRQRRLHPAAMLGAAVTGALILNESLKVHFHRLRPTVGWAIGHEPTFSFPSGHSLFAAILYGMLAYLALLGPTSAARKVAVLLPAVLLPLGIGLSRIYLGMHYPTDVLAGFAAGLLWLSTLILADRLVARTEMLRKDAALRT